MLKKIRFYINELKVILPLIVIIIIFMSILGIIVYRFQLKELNDSIKKNEETLLLFYNDHIEDVKKIDQLLFYVISQNPIIQNLYLNKDRDKLLSETNVLLNYLNKTMRLDKLYFYTTEGQIFLRTHDPIRHSDFIEPNILSNIQKLKLPYYLIDNHNKSGFLFIRAIFPWYLGEKLIGYIEFASDFNYIIDNLKNELNIKLELFVPKKNVEEQRYILESKKRNLENNFNYLKDNILVSKPIDNVASYSKVLFENYEKNKVVNVNQFSMIELKDFDNNQIGKIFVVFNIEDKLKQISSYVNLAIIITLIKLIILVIYFLKAFRYLLNMSLSISNLGRLASVGESSAKLSHEITNVLTTIIGKSERLKRKINDDKVKKDIEIIEKSADRAYKIVNSIRKLSRNESENDVELIEIKNIIDEIKEVSSLGLKGTNIYFIEKNYCEDINIRLKCKEIQVVQILTNLINNARDALNENKNMEIGERWIEFLIRIDHSFIELRITNSGPKISEKVQKKLFTKYFTTKGSTTGTGIGLNLSREMAIENGGFLDLDKKNPNTSFVLTIPYIYC